MVLEFSVMVLLCFSAGLPHCFYIIILTHFKGCCWLRSVFITQKIYILSNTSLIMNTAYLKVTCGLRFHLFFFSRRGLLMSFMGIVVHQLWSSAFSRKDEARAVTGTGMTRHVFFEQLLGWYPWDLVPYANCSGTDFVHDIVHIAQTGPQGHFSVGPQVPPHSPRKCILVTGSSDSGIWSIDIWQPH